MEEQKRVMPDTVSRSMGREAQRNNIIAAKLVAEIVKTTLGPKGMDKMLVDRAGNIIVTNDGVTILEEMELDHPAAKMLVEIAKTQEQEVGDGTTTVVLLAGKLLEYAEHLLDRKIHPTVIIRGYRAAAARALEIINTQAQPVASELMIRQIAMTAMTGKGAEGSKEHLAQLIASAVQQVSSINNALDIDSITIIKRHGESIEDSELIQGVIVDQERVHAAMPSYVEQARILLLDIPLEVKSPETEAKISVSTPEQLERFILSEEQALRQMTSAIIASGANVVFCQKGIDDVAQYYLANAGVYACRRVPRSVLERISKATGAKIISSLHDLHIEQCSSTARVEEVKCGDEKYTLICKCKDPRTVTILVRGSTTQGLDEIERALRDGLGDVAAALKSKAVVAGGGAIEIELARQLQEFARTIKGREQLAVQEFARSLESVPETLAENAGLDPLEVVAELKQKHEAGYLTCGLNLISEKIEDTAAAGIIEPLKVKVQAITSATEVATLILRIDDVLISRDSSEKRKHETMYQEPID